MKKTLTALWLAVWFSPPLPAAPAPTQVPEDTRRGGCAQLYERLDFYYPPADATGPFRIFTRLNLEDISRIDGRVFEFDARFSLYLAWNDERIAGTLKQLGLFDGDNPRWICDWEPAAVWGEKKKLFDPGVEFKNRKLKTDYHGGRADWIEVYSNGTQVVRLRDNATFRSPFRLKRFPFDEQTLQIDLLSVFDKDTVVLDRNMPDYLLPFVAGDRYQYGELDGTPTPEWEIGCQYRACSTPTRRRCRMMNSPGKCRPAARITWRGTATGNTRFPLGQGPVVSAGTT